MAAALTAKHEAQPLGDALFVWHPGKVGQKTCTTGEYRSNRDLR